MRRTLAILLPMLVLAACNLPHTIKLPGTATFNPQNCYFTWATQPLPGLSAQVQAAIHTAGLTGISAVAEAYGENCTDSQTNQPVSFAAMETDFHITAKVADLTDKDDLGNLLEKILVVLDTFPPGKLPGPQPGEIQVSFQKGSDELNLTFSIPAEKSARAQGLHGSALFNKLQNK